MSISTINKEALKIFNKVGFPHPNHEDWKYTNLNNFHSCQFSKSDKHTISNEYKNNFYDYDKIITINGKPNIDLNHDRVTIDYISKVLNDSSDNANLFNISDKDYNNPFLILNTAHFSDGIYIKIPKNIFLDDPIYLLSICDDNNLKSSYSRLYIDAEENSEIKIIHHHIGAKKQKYYRNNATFINAKENSNVFFTNIYEESEESFSMNNLIINQRCNSQINMQNFFIKSGFFRSSIRGNLNGKGSSVAIDGLFLGDKNQFIDNNIIINHNKAQTESKVIYKGILDDYANAVFNGLINVPFKSKHINSDQKNHNIILSKTAKVNSNPKLKISCDDVKCSHGSTMGNLDKDALFYLRSRGIELEKSKKILLNSFMNEIIEKVSFVDIKNYLEQRISDLN